MYELNLTLKSLAELNAVYNALAGNVVAPDEKTLKDFSLQEIADHLIGQGYGIVRRDEIRTEPKEEPKKPKAKKAIEEARELVQAATETADIADTKDTKAAEAAEIASAAGAMEDPAALKDAAIKLIMSKYENPAGKKVAGELLKIFAVKNFHLIPEDRWVEFHDKTVAAFAAAGV
jgi:hypothetical protein